MNPNYQSYLLRFQRQPSQKHWRVTLKDARTGCEHHFATEMEVLRYLLQQLSQSQLTLESDDANEDKANDLANDLVNDY